MQKVEVGDLTDEEMDARLGELADDIDKLEACYAERLALWQEGRKRGRRNVDLAVQSRVEPVTVSAGLRRAKGAR